MSGSEANSFDLYFGTPIPQGQAHRRHVRGSDRHTPAGSVRTPVCSGPTRHRSPAGAARCASGKGVRGRPGRAESTIMGRRYRNRARGRAGGETESAADTRTRRDVEAPRLRHVRHSHSTMTHSAHHTHTTHSSRAPPALISDARCTRRHGTHKRQHSRAAYGLWGSPSPPRHNHPPTKLTNRPTSRAARPRPRTLPHTCPLWTHRTTSTSHPAPLAGSHAPRHAATHCTHTPRSRKEGGHTDSSHFVTSSTLSLQLVASLGLP